MPNRKTNAAKSKTILPGPDGQKDLGLQLRREIDQLALLLEQVRKQSERVQAAADAVGCNLVLDLESSLERHTRQESKQWRPRRGKVVPFAPDRDQANIRPV